jgi:hypothetical protein
MKFAKVVFIAAGIWGIGVLTPLYWLVDVSGRRYGEIAFLIIGSNPARFRMLMIPGMLEKLGYVVGLSLLYQQARVTWADAQAAVPDFVLAILMMLAFVKTRPSTAYTLNTTNDRKPAILV